MPIHPRLHRLSPDAHGWFDQALMIALALAPLLFPRDTPRVAALACFLMVPVLWLLSVLTRYEFGLFPALSLRVHCAIELLLAVFLFTLPWLAGFADSPVPSAVLRLAALAVLLAPLVTDRRARPASQLEHEPPVDRGALPPHQAQ